MDQRQAMFLNKRIYRAFAFIEVAPLKNNLGTKGAGARHFGKGSLGWHDNGCRNAHMFGVIGHRLGMIACRHGNDAKLALFIVQAKHRIQRTTRLE